MFGIFSFIERIRNYINLFLKIIKWPVALMMVLILPAAFQSFHRYYIVRHQLNWHNLIFFAIGAGLFAVFRVAFLLRRGKAETLEHEMTHTLFAMATLHPVEKIEVREEGGGFMTFSGEGNWLIAISPYFFPLTAFTMMFFAIAINHVIGHTPDWVYIGLGMTLCYNLFSFAEQTHLQQTDFKVVGYLFTLLFLPGANCLTFGTIFSFTERGFGGILFYYKLLSYYARHDIQYVLNLF